MFRKALSKTVAAILFTAAVLLITAPASAQGPYVDPNGITHTESAK